MLTPTRRTPMSTASEPQAPPAAGPTTLSSRQVVLKLCSDDLDSIKSEIANRKSLQRNGALIDGIVPILEFPVRDMPFIVMPDCGDDLENVDLTDDNLRGMIEGAYGAFEKTLADIHDAGFVVFDIYPRNILVQRVDGGVKLWLTDLESMHQIGEACSGSPQKRIGGEERPKTASTEDDDYRWRLVKEFVTNKGLVSPFDVNKCK